MPVKSFTVPVTSRADLLRLLTGEPVTLRSAPRDYRGSATMHEIVPELSADDVIAACTEAIALLRAATTRE